VRFPSIAMVAGEAGRTFRRFPLVAVSAFLAAASAVAMVEEPASSERYLRLLAAASLGLPLFTALTLVTERPGWPGLGRGAGEGKRPWPPLAAGLLHLAGVAVLAAIYLAWPHWRDPLALRRYLQLSLAFHLLAAFLPFAGPGERNGFWQYNKTLFIRFLTAALYAHVLFAGLSVALLAVDKLFGVDVDGNRYPELWILIGFLFTTGFFLGGIPRQLGDLDAVTEYPRGLRVFSQFILVPLVTVYLVILTVYLGKIAVTRVWPSGWIGYLVSSVSVAGILSLLLVAPVRERTENAWIASYSRWFYIVLLPSLGMLLLAVGKRIAQYGVTENRYFLMVLSGWLALVSLYFILRRAGSIKVIPGTLCAVALITLGGPWGAYQVSARSQTHRLAGILEANGMLVDGRAQNNGVKGAAGQVSFEDRREMSAIFTYLLETHGTAPIAGWFADGLAAVDTVGGGARGGDRWRATRQTQRILDDLGVTYVEKWDRRESESYFHRWAAAPGAGFPVAGYDQALYLDRPHLEPATVGDRTLRVDYEAASTSLRVREGERVVVRFPLDPLVERLRARTVGNHPTALPDGVDPVETVAAEAEGVAALLVVRQLAWEDAHPGVELEVTGLDGEILFRFRP